MLRKLWLTIALLGLNLFVTAAQATLDLELTQGIDSAIPIAILPFSGQEVIISSTNNVHDVVSKDLQNSGRFRLADTTGLLPDIQNKGALNFSYWQNQKVNNIVTGQVKKSWNGEYQVSFKLLDVYSRTTLLERQYSVKETQLRALAHHISDLIYQQLTGDRGVFSTKIAYIVVNRGSNDAQNAKYSLEVADIDGFNPHTLLVSAAPLMSPTWSPNGKQIAYVSFEGNRAAIFVQDITSGQRRVLTNYPGINGAPAWSPDGTKMALVLSQTGYPKIYILDVASGKLDALTTGSSLDTEPSFAPDGRSLIFTSNRGGSSPQIYRISLASKQMERVTFKGSYNARASFTSDGKNIVMLHQDGDMFNIAVEDLKSGRMTTLTRSGNDESPSVAPNGKMLAYATNADGRGVLAEVSIDGRVKLLLPAREGEVEEPAWSPFLDNNRN